MGPRALVGLGSVIHSESIHGFPERVAFVKGVVWAVLARGEGCGKVPRGRAIGRSGSLQGFRIAMVAYFRGVCRASTHLLHD